MVAWWTGDNTTADLTGYGHDVDWFQLATKAYTTGKVGAASSFATNLEWVEKVFSDLFLFLDETSIDAWIRTTTRISRCRLSDGTLLRVPPQRNLGFAFGDGDRHSMLRRGRRSATATGTTSR
jgi:hypothetical protein